MPRKTTQGKAKKPGPPKGSGGRPPKLIIDDDVIRQVETMAGLGISMKQIVLILGISENTFRSYMERHPELSEAYQRGKAKGMRDVAQSLRDQINDGNTTATIFYLKTQGRWSEPSRLELSGPDGGPIKVDDARELLSTTLAGIAERIKQNE